MSLFSYEGFAVLTVLMLALDLYQTRGGKVTIKKAAIWSIFWFHELTLVLPAKARIWGLCDMKLALI